MGEDGGGGMGQRGVTRPMAMHQSHGENHAHHKPQHQHHDHHAMSDEDRQQMLRQHHQQTQWVYWLLIFLGIWILVSPLTFSYGSQIVAPGGGRSLWLSDHARVWAMTWSDWISGLLLIVLGWRSLTPDRPVSLWGCCFVGIWLTFAPVLFWAPTAAAYLNATVVGAIVIALSILIPGMPNMILYMKMGPPTPPGWSYNPSSWPQRWILIVLALAGWLVSRYLAAFQMGYISHAWDPFFGEGTRRVLNSDMSHMWPISDGGLGALAYTFEFLMGWMGSPARWRTMPWMVLFFGILVIPLGLTHILLVISQPVIVGQWCSLCLLAAALMLVMIPLTVDEVVAMGQHVVQATRRGESFWHVFWKGGAADGSTLDENSPHMMDFPHKPLQVTASSLWGMSFVWPLVASTLLGIWLMCTPWLLAVGRPAANVYHVGGALIITVAMMAMGEPIRPFRYVNIVLGLTIAIVPWLVDGGSTVTQFHGLLMGLAVVALSWPRGAVTQRYGGWDRYIV